MKKKLLYASLFILILITTMSLFSRDKTPQVPYTVLRQDGNFELRQYGTVLYASVEKNGHMMDMGNTGFRELAGYIFGGNQASQKIAMTAPVNFEKTTDTETRMSFSMPEGFQLSSLPKPESRGIQLHETQPRKMAVLRFGGFASNNKIDEKAAELREWLRKENIRWKEPVIFMAYNSPWTLIGRRNEVGFEVE